MSAESLLADYLAVIGADGEALLRRGQFHDVVLLGDVAYRFPRDDASRRALPAQVALLGALARCALPAAVPEPVAPPDLEQPTGRCYVALRRVEGQRLGPGAGARPGVLTDLGRLLSRFGELGTDPAISAVAPPAGRDAWTRFADQVSRVLFPLMSGQGRARATAELAAVTAVDPTGQALVHGDLGGPNLLWAVVDGDARLAGVIDWDEAHIGSQAEDLASLAVTFGWPLAEQIAAGLPPGGPGPLDDGPGSLTGGPSLLADARAIAATFALQQALPAALSGDEASLADGLTRYVAGESSHRLA